MQRGGTLSETGNAVFIHEAHLTGWELQSYWSRGEEVDILHGQLCLST